MTKIRTVKPELFRHSGLFEAEINSKLPIRLAFIGLFGSCDREGRFRWEPRSLKLDILPYDEINFEQILNVLWEAGFIKKYSTQNKYYGYIPTWHLHQSINKREPASKLPNPQQCAHELPSSVQDTEITMQSHATHQHVTAMHQPDNAVTATSSLVPQPVMQSTETPKVTNLQGIPAPSTQKTPELKKSITYQSCAHSAAIMRIPVPEMHVQARAMHKTAPEMQMPASLEVELEMEVEREMEVEVEREREGEQEKKGILGANRNIVAPARRRSAIAAKILSVFDFWKTTFQHPQAVLDSKQQRLIQQALQHGYTAAQLCAAIMGYSRTPHNVGYNDNGQQHDGLHIILRDNDQIEQFIHHHQNQSMPQDHSGKLLLEAGKKLKTMPKKSHDSRINSQICETACTTKKD